MLRLLRHTDIDTVVRMMLALRHTTAWSKYTREGYTYEALQQFISDRAFDPRSVCYVWDTGHGGVSAFCGGTLTPFNLPPHMPVVYEWGWYGSPREAVTCWKQVCAWAKLRGAELGYRVSGRPGSTMNKFCELGTWEVL